MPTVVLADGHLLNDILDAPDPGDQHGLTSAALRRFNRAQGRTDWASQHQHRVALMDGDTLIASAQRSSLTAVLDQQPVSVCAIGEVRTGQPHGSAGHARVLVEQLLGAAERDGASLALLFPGTRSSAALPDGFSLLPTVDVELEVKASRRHGAPMALVRGGEDRDLPAIVEMGRARAGRYRFHLDRDIGFIKHVITRRRLLAGLAPAGAREVQFFIAEEGITAAAYVVIAVTGRTWTLEECGDRDASGARVGALLQALIARAPAEQRPIVRAWLPAGFLPPQVSIVSTQPSSDAVMMKVLRPGAEPPPEIGDALYWHNDVF